jgi:hypothetical protein
MRSKSTAVLMVLLTALAMSAVVASAASAAAPEFVPNKPTKPKFTGKEGPTTLSIATGQTITCKNGKTAGEITGPKTVGSVSVTLEGCETENKNKESCYVNSGTNTNGTLSFETLSGELGAVNKTEAASGVGEALKPAKGTSFFEIKVPCLELGTFKLVGSVIGEIKELGKPLKSNDLSFTVSPTNKTKQMIQFCQNEIPSAFDLCPSGPKERKDTLTVGGSPTGFESKDEVTFEEPIEVT